MAVNRIEIPHDWTPRDYQMPLWEALQTGVRRACVVWHRRAGKDAVSLNWTIREAFRRKGIYWHVLPTYRQARKIVWEGMTKDGRRYIDHWPEELITRKRDDEMTLWLANGSIWQCVGAETEEDVNKLVGTNPVGVVFSEYSLHLPAAWDLVRPILAENDGWALFLYTPRGRNHGYRLFEQAKDNPNWYAELLTVDETKTIRKEAIDEDRASGMPEELVQQEYWCSFDAPLVGSYYGDLISQAESDDRIVNVPWEPKLPVETWWDLGVADATAIWFVQRNRTEYRVIDYYQHSGVGLQHYARILKEKSVEAEWSYSKHLVPHDAAVRELGSGQSRVETARQLGLPFTVVPRLDVADGIQACRNVIPKCYFDKEKCQLGLQALREYTKERLPGMVGPNGEVLFRDKPRHDWTSHPADAFRTGCVGSRIPRSAPERLAPSLSLV